MPGPTIAQQYFPQDNNLIIQAAGAITGDTSGTYKDFGVPGGAPDDCFLVIEVTAIPSGKTMNVELRESTDKFASNDTDTLLHYVGIAAVGTYIIPISNRVIKQRSFRPKFRPVSLTTGQSVTMRAYLAWD
jgi:hypothetical protein